ncbi:hypothetical protein AWM68_04010 [Fictibacillus phosphorivorans]|uniref:Lipoprotein n=1 Tax=Fictibacillus phosphorivorans TaxID=1221500 RepID=A0A163SMV7_9BACL|nr:hypothetical protein [Fictibacillus phosphorivorans]KZE69438.1 hypothetical protein AWM68_04010 [Fictibacillus phosphorivorans]
MTKKPWTMILIALLVVVLTACSSESNQTETKEPVSKTAEPVQKEAVEEAKGEHSSEPVTSIDEDGTYIGQIDNNSIEVEAAGETLVLRLSEDVRESVANVKEGSKVNITYKKNENGQWLLEKITPLETGSNEAAETKMLSYSVNGASVEEEATLTKSEQMDYHFYKLRDFEFTAEEPRKDLLFATAFAETFVRIEPLSEEASMDDLKDWANDELKAVGEVKELDGGEIAGPAFESSILFITASKDSFKKYIVIQTQSNGDHVKYTVNLPQHKNAAKWEQGIWAMLSTLQTK